MNRQLQTLNSADLKFWHVNEICWQRSSCL